MAAVLGRKETQNNQGKKNPAQARGGLRPQALQAKLGWNSRGFPGAHSSLTLPRDPVTQKEHSHTSCDLHHPFPVSSLDAPEMIVLDKSGILSTSQALYFQDVESWLQPNQEEGGLLLVSSFCLPLGEGLLAASSRAHRGQGLG